MEFVDCVFTGTLRDVAFYGRLAGPYEFAGGTKVSRVNEMHGNDFSSADLVDTTFRFGVDLTRQSLPTGVDYVAVADVDTAVMRTRPLVRQWPQPVRRQGEFLLDLLERELSYGQRQALLRRSEWDDNEGRRNVLDLLAGLR